MHDSARDLESAATALCRSYPPGQGQIAQQIFWYTAFVAPLTKKGLPVVNEDGTPKWRMAPSPHGPYWEEGMKLGYQDAGSWTRLKHGARAPQSGLALRAVHGGRASRAWPRRSA